MRNLDNLLGKMQKRITGQLYGLEKFWAYLEYSQSKTQPVDPKLQEYLSRFKKLEDFRVDLLFSHRTLEKPTTGAWW